MTETAETTVLQAQVLEQLRDEYRELYRRIVRLYSLAEDRIPRPDLFQARLNEMVKLQSHLITKYDQVFFASHLGELEIKRCALSSDLLASVFLVKEETNVQAWWTHPSTTVEAFVDCCRFEQDPAVQPHLYINAAVFVDLAEYFVASGLPDIRERA